MIIGITGGIGSGKSTVADLLCEERGFTVIEFSEKLKDVCAQVFCEIGVDESAFFGTQDDKNAPLLGVHPPGGVPLTGRRILELVGTDGFRAALPSVWVDYVFSLIDANPGDWVIPGLRFQNEADAIHDRSGEVWRIEVVGGPHESSATGHESDQVWRELRPDRVISATYRDIESLRDQVRAAL